MSQSWRRRPRIPTHRIFAKILMLWSPKPPAPCPEHPRARKIRHHHSFGSQVELGTDRNDLSAQKTSWKDR